MSSGCLLSVPLSRLASYGDQAFLNIAPRPTFCNTGLQQEIKDAENMSSFTHKLKGYPFCKLLIRANKIYHRLHQD